MILGGMLLRDHDQVKFSGRQKEISTYRKTGYLVAVSKCRDGQTHDRRTNPPNLSTQITQMRDRTSMLGTSQYKTPKAKLGKTIDHARLGTLGMVNLRLADAVVPLRIRRITNKNWGHRGLAWQTLEQF